jgi:outer membrane biosynthesis protein TonB
MKTHTLKTLTLAALMSLGLAASAASVTPTTGNNNVAQKIKNSIRLPEELKNSGFTQKVKVSFVMNANGKVADVAANTKNLLLKQNVEEQFKQLTFPELSAGTYNLELDFIVY